MYKSDCGQYVGNKIQVRVEDNGDTGKDIRFQWSTSRCQRCSRLNIEHENRHSI